MIGSKLNKDLQVSNMQLKEVKDILSNINSAPSGIRMSTDNDYEFQVKEINDDDESVNGFLIRCGFWRPDTFTGEMGQGWGRWNHVPRIAGEKGVVMTAYVAIKLIVEHEMMEAFEYKKVKLVNPHKSLSQLAHPKFFN